MMKVDVKYRDTFGALGDCLLCSNGRIVDMKR